MGHESGEGKGYEGQGGGTEGGGGGEGGGVDLAAQFSSFFHHSVRGGNLNTHVPGDMLRSS